jgi:NAD(P)-dependent dehydrogenase (short-subunit alcohol dehydrogenase family)
VQVRGELGHVDILVNNAAYTVGKALWTHAPHLTREQGEKGMAINVTAPLMLIQGFWASMASQGGGVVVNVTSGAALPQPLDASVGLTGSSLPDSGPIYGATKAALNRMVKCRRTGGGEGADRCHRARSRRSPDRDHRNHPEAGRQRPGEQRHAGAERPGQGHRLPVLV